MKKSRSQLLKDFVAPDPDIESILSRLSIILSDLPETDKTIQINDWINNELSGYPDIELLPTYRIIKARPMGMYVVNGAYQYKNSLVPIRLSKMPSDEIDKLEVLKLTNSIKEIQNMIKKDSAIGIPIPTELLHVYSSYELQMLRVTMQLEANQLITIETTVKSKLRKIILELDKEFTNLDELDISEEVSADSQKTKDITQTIFNTITDNSINIGDKNKIKDTKLGHFIRKK